VRFGLSGRWFKRKNPGGLKKEEHFEDLYGIREPQGREKKGWGKKPERILKASLANN